MPSVVPISQYIQTIIIARYFVSNGRRVRRNPLQIAPAGAVAKFERHFLHPRLPFPYIGRRDQKKRYYQSERTAGRLSLVSRLPSLLSRHRHRRRRRRDTSLVRERASDRCELRRRGLCKREWFLSTGREIDRENVALRRGG